MPGRAENRYPLLMQKLGKQYAGITSCVIYVRMSQDRAGEELGVERHEADCRELAAELGLTVDRVYSDNDLSATSGKARPEFEQMLAARPQAIITWHQDRLLRLTKDLERVIELGCPVFMVHQSMLDLATPAGRAVARTVAAWSQYEGEQKKIRQQSKNLQLAEHGHWQFSLRPYGYERVDGKIVQVAAEIEVLREGYRRVLAGESYRQVSLDWNRRGVKPLLGDSWKPARVQRMLENSHYGGVPSYGGEEVELAEGKSIQWEPVLTPREWRDFVELKLNRKRERSWGVSPKYLMSGMLECGVCGGTMFTHHQDRMTRDVETRERWRDSWDAARRAAWVERHGGKDPLPTKAPRFREDGSRVKRVMYVCFEDYCTSISGEVVDEGVRAAVLKVLADERIARALRPGDETGSLLDEIADLQRRRDDVAELVVDGLMDKAKGKAKLEELVEKLDRANARLAAVRAESPLSDIRLAESVPERWDSIPVLEKRRIVSDLGLRLKIEALSAGPAPVVTDGSGKQRKLTAREVSMRRIVPVSNEGVDGP